MRHLNYFLSPLVALALCSAVLGCKPDAAIRKGEVIGAGPKTSDTVKGDSQPNVKQPNQTTQELLNSRP